MRQKKGQPCQKGINLTLHLLEAHMSINTLPFTTKQKFYTCPCLTLKSQTSPGFYVSVVRTSRLKTLWEKEKLLVTSNRNCSLQAISPFPALFSIHFGKLSTIFIKYEIVVCKLF